MFFQGETKNPTSKKCEECDVNNCSSCDYTEKNKCIACKSGFFLSLDKLQCGIDCLIGLFFLY